MRSSALLQEVSLFHQSSVLLYQSSSLSPSVPASLVVLTANGAPVAAAVMMPVLLMSMMLMMMMWHCPDLVLPALLSRCQSGQCRVLMSMSRCMWRKMMLLAEEGCS